MGGLCTSGPFIPDEDIMAEMEQFIGESINSIPTAYAKERQRVIDEMRRLSPEPYETLLFDDYPTKNGAQVNALARQNVTSDRVKREIAGKVNEKLQPIIESQISDMNPINKEAANKTIESMIETAVKSALDGIVLDEKNIATTKTPQ